MQLYANHSVLGKMEELDQILGKGWQFEDNCWSFYVQKVCNLYANILWRNFAIKKPDKRS